MARNIWDVSDILLRQRAGDIYGGMFANLGQQVGAGIQQYVEQKKQNKMMEGEIKSTVDFLEKARNLTKDDPQRTAQIDQTLAQLGDPNANLIGRYTMAKGAAKNIIDLVSLGEAVAKTRAQEIENQRNQAFMAMIGQQPTQFAPTQPVAPAQPAAAQAPSMMGTIGQFSRMGLPTIMDEGVSARAAAQPGAAAPAAGQPQALFTGPELIRRFGQTYGFAPTSASQLMEFERMLKPAAETERYRPGALYKLPSGETVTSLVDERAAKVLYRDPTSGELKDIPAGSKPTTATTEQKAVVPMTQFKQMADAVIQDESSLRNLNRYMKSVDSMAQGFDLLADKFSTGMKTLFNEGKLTPQELSQAMASGQFEGLLGQNRLNIVGGGTMTEQDALRIVRRLGGNPGALQNKELVAQAISEVYTDRLRNYESNLKFYNAQVKDYYGERGFEEKKSVRLNPKLTLPMEEREGDEEPVAPAVSPMPTQDAIRAERERRRRERGE